MAAAARVERIYLDEEPLIRSVQRCFLASHQTLYAKAPKIGFAFLIQKPFFWFGAAVAIALVVMLLPHEIIGRGSLDTSFWLKLIGLVLLALGFFAGVLGVLFYKTSESKWEAICKETIAEKDLSQALAADFYGKEAKNGSACFGHLATDSNGCQEVVASACLLLGPDVNRFHFGPKNGQTALAEDGSDAVLSRVGVLQQFQGKGLGKAVVLACISYARAKKVKRIVLMTSSYQEAAVNMYRTLGFQIIQQTPLIPAVGAAIFILQLDLI